MPIYAYKCSACGHTQDVLQKMSDTKLTICTACGQATFDKQLTAPGFQLKGSGWYVTDFRDTKKPDAPTAEAKTDAKVDASSDTKADTTGNAQSTATKTDTPSAAPATPVPTTTPAPASAPTAPAKAA